MYRKIEHSKKCVTFAPTNDGKFSMRQTKIVIITIVLISLCFISTTTQAISKKICVLADIHIMAPSLIDDQSNKEWQKYLKTCKTMQDLSIPIFDAVENSILLDKPDLLLIVGDLTKDSEVESHKYILKKLTKIKNSGIPIYVIPGNHDRGWMPRAFKYRNDTCTVAETIDNDGFGELYADYGYGSDTERYGSTLNYMVEPFPGLTIFGVDSGIWCTFREGSIDWVCQKAKEAQSKGNQVLVMIHHMIMPHYYYQNNIFELSIPTDYPEIREKFMKAGIKVILSGHSHTSDITRYTDSSGKEIYDVCTGSPLSYPCDYRMLTFDNNFSKLTITTKSITNLPGYSDFPAYAKERLKESVKNWTQNWMSEKTGIEYEEDEEEGNNNLLISVTSQALSNSFTIHAEGNEPANPESTEAVMIFDDLLRYIKNHNLSNEEIIENISLSMKSVLGDYPSETDKYNVVNDRMLTIQMPNLTNGIEKATANESNASWYTLQGIRLSAPPTHSGIYIQQGKKIYIK